MKATQLFYQVALPVPLRRLYDYLPPVEHHTLIERGTRVRVPFGKRQLTGIIMAHSHESSISIEQLKPIHQICEAFTLFPATLCDLIETTADYYHHPIGEVAFTGLPMAIRQGKDCLLKKPPIGDPAAATTENLILNEEQQAALNAILTKQQTFQPFLLEGITGSGKTEVYLQATEHLLQQHKPVLILVPEISLTPQTEKRFIERFGQKVLCYHSRMTPAQRLSVWLKVRHQQAQIVIGTRSAIFLPFTDLGLIVIDEEHDLSFKQQEGFRYCARDVAVLRAKLQQCPILLGSATPSFETLLNAQQHKYQGLVLSERATQVKLPEITLLDIRHKKLTGGLSQPLLDNIGHHSQTGQVLLFINRRGYAPTYMCYGCGWMAQCHRCDARMTYHHQQRILICHHCLLQYKVPTSCPSCKSPSLNPVGLGTERLETVLQEQFPHLTIARIDSDVARKKGTLEQFISSAQNKEAQLLIGTQMLTKGHHFPHLSMVAIVDADGGLFSVDFRAIERMAQLIIQVAGRAGRVHTAGQVFIQTLHPEHPLLQQILQQNYRQLANHLLQERQQYQLPPFAHMALLRAQASNPSLPEMLLKEVQTHLAAQNFPHLALLGPVAAPMAKRQGFFRYQLLLQSAWRKPLHHALSYLTNYLEQSKLGKRIRWSLDVDPREMF